MCRFAIANVLHTAEKGTYNNSSASNKTQ